MVKKFFKRSLVWLRRDIRLEDNHALSEALENSSEVIIVFIFDPLLLSKLSPGKQGDQRVSFICQGLQEIHQELLSYGGELIIRHAAPQEALRELVDQYEIEAIFFNEDYAPYPKQRDQSVEKYFKGKSVSIFSFKDHVIFGPGEILKSDGLPYVVYTPYKNKWIENFEEKLLPQGSGKFSRKGLDKKIHRPKKMKKISVEEKYQALSKAPLPAPVMKGGRTQANKLLKAFSSKIKSYHQNRDFPALEGTSQIAPYIRHGMVSIRELVHFYLSHQSEGAKVWLSELIWREFYQMILWHFPHVVKGSFKKSYDGIKWPGSDEHFKKWKEGMTGFPLIDAAMRCFHQTGMMHNRLRMVVASFLCKTLLVDWRKGEKYFATQLFDYDLAANSGGWQWSSSSGCDAQPYFRIFNPYNQSKKFDPEGLFIRRYCPELKGFSNKRIHQPELANMFEQEEAKCQVGIDYPLPIVNYSKMRDQALVLYKSALSSSS